MEQKSSKEKVLIYADSREFSSGVVEELSTFDCILRKKPLACGDYLCSDRVCIERKRSEDFAQSIIDGRLFSQAGELKENFEKPLLIIEGNSFTRNIHPNAIYGAIVSLAVDFSLPLIWAKSPKETAVLIYTIAKREQLRDKREVVLRNRKPSLSLQKQQKFLVAGLPNVNSILAERLLKHFGNPKKIFSAGAEELKQVKGVGKEKTKRILSLLESEYEV